MIYKQQAENLVNMYRIILMDEDTDCGNEILCTTIAKQSALIDINHQIALIDKLTQLNLLKDNSIGFKLLEIKKEIKLI